MKNMIHLERLISKKNNLRAAGIQMVRSSVVSEKFPLFGWLAVVARHSLSMDGVAALIVVLSVSVVVCSRTRPARRAEDRYRKRFDYLTICEDRGFRKYIEKKIARRFFSFFL